MTSLPPAPSDHLDAGTQGEIARIRSAGVLGSSGRLLDLFNFLVARSAEGRPPKEAEIAMSVFGKADADAMRDDPVARVYVHRLRKRLDDYYIRNGMPAGLRIDIPKGDYRIIATSEDVPPRADESLSVPTAGRPETAARPSLSKRHIYVAALFGAFLIMANIAAWTIFATQPATGRNPVTASRIWNSIAGSQRPLLLVVGDYYIFGEYENRVVLRRLIRDFRINSKEDLIHSQKSDPDNFDRYSDVALQYLPTSAAFALADLAPLLRENRQVEVSLSSELTPERLKSHDIIYVGLLSGLGPLRDPVFSQSRFGLGQTYDQIVDRRTGNTYTSEAFLTAPSDQMYSDYGFFSSFEGPGGNRIAIVSGTRDTAVMGVAETLTRADSLRRFEKKTVQDRDFETLLVVKGQKHTSLEAQVVASYPLASASIWASFNSVPGPLSGPGR